MKGLSRRDFIKTGALGGIAMAMVPTPSYAPLYNPNVTELIQFIKGDLPVLITAAHGGNELVFGIPARTNITRPVANFTFFGVVWTYEIAITVSRTLQRLSGGKKPYMVLNLAHRRYIDVNREDSDAYEVTLNAPRIYWEYHDNIREFINQMNIIYKNPIMVDITGHQEMPNLILRRTLNGKSVRRMVNRIGNKVIERKISEYKEKIDAIKDEDKKEKALKFFKEEYEKIASDQKIIKKYGNESYTGEESLIGEIKKRGYNIDPALGIPDLEVPQTTAGDFSLDRYGSHQDIGGMDCVQLVIGKEYRKTQNYQQTGRDIGNAIWSFLNKYGPYSSFS